MSPAWGQQALSGKKPRKSPPCLCQPWVTADPHRPWPPVPETPHLDGGACSLQSVVLTPPAPFILPAHSYISIKTQL